MCAVVVSEPDDPPDRPNEVATCSDKRGWAKFTLRAHPQAPAQLADLDLLLAGELDLKRLSSLARPLMALKRSKELDEALRCITQSAPTFDERDADVRFAITRLMSSPYELQVGEGSLGARFDPEVLRRLAAGELERALQLASRRLRSSGFRLPVNYMTGSSELARELLISLAFPPSSHTLTSLARAHLA